MSTPEPLSGLDARFLYSETEHAYMHTLKVAVLDLTATRHPFDRERFTTVLEQRVRRLPPLLRKAVSVPFGMGHPVWVEDPAFSMDRHLTIRTIDPPGGAAELARVVAEVAACPLPRDRPLWAATLLTGLADDRVAVIMRIHHSVADGGAAVEMLRRVVDDAATTPSDSNPSPSEPLPSRRELARIAARARQRKVRTLPHVAIASARNTTVTAWRRWRAPIRAAKPFDGPRTSLNGSLSGERTFAMTTLPLSELLGLRQSLGGTFNDVYLTICAGALRRYFAARNEYVDHALVASVPIGIRGEDAGRISGNRVDNMYVRIPVQITDPAARFRAVHDDAAAARALREVMDPGLVAQRGELTPAHLHPLVLRAFANSRLANRLRPPVNLVISNVAGPRDQLRLGGAVLESIFSVGPILEGVGLNLTAWSYAGGLHIAALGCPRSLPDPWALVDRLPEALAELSAIPTNRTELNTDA